MASTYGPERLGMAGHDRVVDGPLDHDCDGQRESGVGQRTRQPDEHQAAFAPPQVGQTANRRAQGIVVGVERIHREAPPGGTESRGGTSSTSRAGVLRLADPPASQPSVELPHRTESRGPATVPRVIAFVTGGGRGIGANIARKLAEEGWEVVVAARTLAQVETVADEIGGRAVALDVADREAVERAVSEAGPVELLVANAGISGRDGATWEIEPDDWWRTFEVNVLGVHLCCRAVIPGMLERGSGRIVITGSGAAYLRTATHRLPAQQGGGLPLRRVARRRARRTDPRLLLQPGARAYRHDLLDVRRRALDAARAGSAARRGARHRSL